MLPFLRKMFNKQAERQVREETVRLADLERWVEDNVRPVVHAAQDALNERVRLMAEDLVSLASSVQTLAAAQLMNENIPERAKQVMAGNRDAFLRATTQLQGAILLPKTVDDIATAHQQTTDAIQAFLETVNRPFAILQEFFANETKEALGHVRSIERHSNALLQLRTERKLESIARLRQAVADLRALQTRIEGRAAEIRLARTRLGQLEKESASAQRDLADIESSDDHAALMAAKAELESTITGIKRLRATIIERFSQIEPALKKYEHMTLHHRQLVADYLAQPVETLARDRELTVLHIIAAMRKEIEADRIDLKDRKKDKVMAAIAALTRDSLGAFLKEYSSFVRQEQAMVSRIDAMEVLRRLSQARARVRQLEEERGRIGRALDDTQARTDPQAVEEAKRAVSGVAQECFGIAPWIR